MKNKNKFLIKIKKNFKKINNKIKLIIQYFFTWCWKKYLNFFYYIKQNKLFKQKLNIILLPYIIIMILLIIIPLIIILLYSLIKPTGNNLIFEINFKNFIIFFSEQKFVISLFISLGYSLIAALIAIIIAYPAAYIMAFYNSKLLLNNILVLITLPIWINMLLRIIGLQTLFNIIAPELIGTPISIIIGMVYMFLPFVILPIFNSLNKIDISLIEASKDLGANNFKTFWKIIFRQSTPGIISGGILLLVQSVTSLIIIKFMGNGQINLIADVIESYFFKGENFGIGSTISVILALIIFFIILLSNLLSKYFEIRKENNNEKFF